MVHPRSPDPSALFADEPTSAELCSWLDAIAEITRAANRGVQLAELLDLIAGATARLTGYDFCAVFVEDPVRRCLLIAASYGLSQEYVDTINAHTPIPVGPGDTGEGPSSRAFRSQRPTTVFDISADAPSRAWETIAGKQGYSSLLSVPLFVRQAPFGLLNCYTVDKHDFTAREIVLMESMANQAGLAIETTRRLAEAQERAQNLAERSARLEAELEAVEHADADHAELLRVVLKGGGPAAIAESLGAQLRCTVVVDDAAGRVLAASGGGRYDARIMASYEQARAGVGAEADREVVTLAPGGDPDAGAGIVVPVLVDEDVAGHVWALRPRAELKPAHRQALVRATAVVAFALLKERTAQEVEWRLSRDFLDDLLGDMVGAGGQAGEALHARARQLGADLTTPHTLLVVRRDPGSGGPCGAHADREASVQRSLLALVQSTAAAWDGATLTATRSDHVVVLWRDEHARSAAEFAHHLRREILAYAAGWTATISVGPSCTDLLEYADAYRLTCSVLDLVQQADRGNRVVALDDVGPYRLLLQVKRPSELQAFAQSLLGAVHAYDRRHHARLAVTLRTYLSRSCNAALTAKALHVHANTVGYRLRRVQQLLGVDLDDPQALLHVQLALMIEDIVGE